MILPIFKSIKYGVRGKVGVIAAAGIFDTVEFSLKEFLPNSLNIRVTNYVRLLYMIVIYEKNRKYNKNEKTRYFAANKFTNYCYKFIVVKYLERDQAVLYHMD